MSVSLLVTTSVHTHCIAHPSASYKCWTFSFPQPTRLPSAWKSDTASKAFRFYYWITLSRTQSSHLLPQRREASHHSWVRPSKCAYRGPLEIISWAQSAHWRDQYIMFVWMAGNFVFHRDHLKQTSLPLLLEYSLLISEEKLFDSVNSRVFLLWLMRFRTICRKCEGKKSCENLWQPLNLLSSAAQSKAYLWLPWRDMSVQGATIKPKCD